MADGKAPLVGRACPCVCGVWAVQRCACLLVCTTAINPASAVQQLMTKGNSPTTEDYHRRLPAACHSRLQSTAVLDFSLIEKKVLIGTGVQLTFEDIILANVK